MRRRDIFEESAHLPISTSQANRLHFVFNEVPHTASAKHKNDMQSLHKSISSRFEEQLQNSLSIQQEYQLNKQQAHHQQSFNLHLTKYILHLASQRHPQAPRTIRRPSHRRLSSLDNKCRPVSPRSVSSRPSSTLQYSAELPLACQHPTKEKSGPLPEVSSFSPQLSLPCLPTPQPPWYYRWLSCCSGR